MGKNATTAVAALAIVGTAVTGCGGGSSGDSGATITMLKGATPPSDKGAATFYKKLAEKFHQQTGATLKYQTYSNQNQEITQLNAEFATHSGPDVIEFGSTVAPIGLKNGGFRKLSDADWKAVGGRDRFFASSDKLMGPSASESIAVPEYVFPYEMVYNTSLFRRAGISKPPATWPDFIKDGQAISKLGGGTSGTALQPVGGSDNILWKIVYLFTKQFGGDFLTDSGKTATLDSSAVADATNFYFDWLTKYHIAPAASSSWSDQQAVSAFAAGKIGMLPIQGPGVASALVGGAIGKNYAFAPIPSNPPGSSANLPTPAYTLDDCYAISSYTPHASLALKAVNLFTSYQMEVLEYQTMGVYPANKQAAAYAAKHSDVIRTFQRVVPSSIGSPFSVVWGDFENQVPTVIQRLGAAIGTHSYTPDLVKSSWKSANQILQRDIESSH